jgi:hypothetical protein
MTLLLIYFYSTSYFYNSNDIFYTWTFMLFLEFKGKHLEATVNLPSTYDPTIRTVTVQDALDLYPRAWCIQYWDETKRDQACSDATSFVNDSKVINIFIPLSILLIHLSPIGGTVGKGVNHAVTVRTRTAEAEIQSIIWEQIELFTQVGESKNYVMWHSTKSSFSWNPECK